MRKYDILYKNASLYKEAGKFGLLASAVKPLTRTLGFGAKKVLPFHLLSSGLQAVADPDKDFGGAFVQNVIDPKNLLVSTVGTAGMAGLQKGVGALGSRLGTSRGIGGIIGRTAEMVDPARLKRTQTILSAAKGKAGTGPGLFGYIAKGKGGFSPEFAEQFAAKSGQFDRLRSQLINKYKDSGFFGAREKAFTKLTSPKSMGGKVRSAATWAVNPLDPYSGASLGLGITGLGAYNPIVRADQFLFDPSTYSGITKSAPTVLHAI